MSYTNPEIAKINLQIAELKEKKFEIKEASKDDIDIKKKNHYNNSPNDLIRVSIKLIQEIDNINTNREESGFGKLSNPKVTELIARHKLFNKIKEDIIHFDATLEVKNDKK